jgi:hypothetical protein
MCSEYSASLKESEARTIVRWNFGESTFERAGSYSAFVGTGIFVNYSTGLFQPQFRFLRNEPKLVKLEK